MVVFSGEQVGYFYSCFGNLIIDVVVEKIVQLEMYGSGEEGYGFFCSLGMLVISIFCLGLLQLGDVIFIQFNLYGGIDEFFWKVFQLFGFEVILVDFFDLNVVVKVLEQYVVIWMVYFEIFVNFILSCVDIKVVSVLAYSYQVIVVVDNIFVIFYFQ